MPCPPSYDLVAHLEFSVGNIRSNIKLTDVHTRTRTKRASAPPSPGRRRPDRRFPPCGNRPTPGRLAPLGVVRGEPGASLVGRIHGSDLPGQIVITRPGGELVQAHGHTPERQSRPPRRSRQPGYLPSVGPYVNGSQVAGFTPCLSRGESPAGYVAGTLLGGGCGGTPQRRAGC